MTDQPRTRAFTLVELLVVIAVIGILIGVLLPALSGARDGARTSQASSNVRQIVTALSAYATDHNLNFPPNVDLYFNDVTNKRGLRWFDEPRIGTYLPQFDESNLNPDGDRYQTVGGGVFTSPMHPQAGRSFTMNYWASSAGAAREVASGKWRFYKPGQIPDIGSPFFDPSENERGIGFNATVGRSSEVFLVADAWGLWPSENTEFDVQNWFTGSQIGQAGFPGERFGGGDNPVNAASETTGWFQNAPEMASVREPVLPTYIPFYRYPTQNLNNALTRDGSALFGFVDGHVGLHSASELVDDATGRSSYRVLWNPADRSVEEAELGAPD